MGAESHHFEDVRLAFVAAISVDNDDGFARDEWWAECRESSAVSCHRWSFDGHAWEQDSEDNVGGGTEATERVRTEYELVEKLFLNKVLTVDRERFELWRAVYATDHYVEFDNVDIDPVEPDLVVSYYEPFNVAIVTVNLQLPSVSADDLVYLKSLKWDSTRRFEGAPGVTVHEGETLRSDDLEPAGRESAYLNAWLQQLFDETIGIGDATLAHGDVLDCIDIRGDGGASVFDKEPAGPLYAAITGDEGYKLNDDEVMQSFLADGVSEMHSREYFRYFFHESSIVALFDDGFPTEKHAFEASYVEQYGSYPPYVDYLGLESKIATLSDGILFAGELLLTRHIALQELDRQLESEPTLTTGLDRLRLHMGGDLRRFIELKESSLNQLTEIEMLSQSLLWGPVPGLNQMFNHENRRESVDRALENLESSIRDKYNRRMQNGILLLTMITALLTLWMGPGPEIWSFLEQTTVAIVDGLATTLT